MQQRIDELEGLVKRLLSQRLEAPPDNAMRSQNCPRPGTGPVVTAVTSDAPDVTRSAGTTVIDGVHSVYKCADDWSDVLQEVGNFLLDVSFLFFSLFLCLVLPSYSLTS